MMLKRRLFLASVAVFLTLFLGLPSAFAQSESQEAKPARKMKMDFSLYDGVIDQENPPAQLNFPLLSYTPLDFMTLTQLYFKAGVLKADNRDVVTEYLSIAECKLFNSTYKDDFLWPEVYKATSKYLDATKRKFSSQLTFIQPVAFERYDPDKEWFSLTTDTQYLNSTTITFADYISVRVPCSGNYIPKYIPKRASLKLGHPFSLTYLKMKPEMAKSYLDYMGKRPTKAEILGSSRDRYAFVKFFLSVTGFDSAKTDFQNVSFLGNIDGYIIFADREETLPLHQWLSPRLMKDENAEDAKEQQAETAPLMPDFTR